MFTYKKQEEKMKNGNYLIVDSTVLPDVFEKVIETKKLLNTNEVSGITEATAKVGISRSTYYKYCNHVFKLSENNIGSKATLSLNLKHKSGTLSSILDIIAEYNGNILTITQDTPVNNNAKVTLKFNISELKISFNELIDELKTLDGVMNLSILIIE
jgi:chorismate mutase